MNNKIINVIVSIIEGILWVAFGCVTVWCIGNSMMFLQMDVGNVIIKAINKLLSEMYLLNYLAVSGVMFALMTLSIYVYMFIVLILCILSFVKTKIRRRFIPKVLLAITLAAPIVMHFVI